MINPYEITSIREYPDIQCGAAGAAIGAVGTIAGLAQGSSSAAAQKRAAADQSAMLAKQAFMNALALNSAQNQLAYDYDTTDLQQRGADLQAVQQNFQNLMKAREAHLANSGQVDQQRFQAQQQYFGTLFNQAQQSAGTVFSASEEANNRMFQSAIAGMQLRASTTQQGQEAMFNTAKGAMDRQQQASTQGLGNILQSGQQGISSIDQTMTEGRSNLFNATSQGIDSFTQASVGRSEQQAQGFQQVSATASALEGQSRELQAQWEQIEQQQSALDAIYAGMVGGNIRETASGQNLRERTGQETVNQQQQFEGSANQALNNQLRQNEYNDLQAGLQQLQAGQLGAMGIDFAGQQGTLNNQNAAALAALMNMNAVSGYNLDVNAARDLGSLEQQNAATQFGLQNEAVTGANSLNREFNRAQNTGQNQFLSGFLGAQDAYAQRNAQNQLGQTNANLNQFLLQSLNQKQAAEQGYMQSNDQIWRQSAANMQAAQAAMLTGFNNAQLQSDANATLNQAQQAALRAQAAGIRSPSIFDYLGAGAQAVQPFLNQSAGGRGTPFTMGYTQPSFNYTPSMNGFLSSGFGNSFGNPASYSYAAAPSSLGLGTLQSGRF